jgi:hypothetical protein
MRFWLGALHILELFSLVNLGVEIDPYDVMFIVYNSSEFRTVAIVIGNHVLFVCSNLLEISLPRLNVRCCCALTISL